MLWPCNDRAPENGKSAFQSDVEKLQGRFRQRRHRLLTKLNAERPESVDKNSQSFKERIELVKISTKADYHAACAAVLFEYSGMFIFQMTG